MQGKAWNRDSELVVDAKVKFIVSLVSSHPAFTHSGCKIALSHNFDGIFIANPLRFQDNDVFSFAIGIASEAGDKLAFSGSV